MNGYNLSRKIFDWSFENPQISNPTAIALYLFFVEVNNRLGWVKEFSITAKECMSAVGVKSYNTYKKEFNLLISENFIILKKQALNQYQCNVIALSNFDKAHNKALDKALMRHTSKHSEGTHQSTCDILKQENNKPINNETKKQKPEIEISFSTPPPKPKKEKVFSENVMFVFDQIKDCFRKINNTEKALETIEKLIRIDNQTENEIIETINAKDGTFWGNQILAITTLRDLTKTGESKFFNLKNELKEKKEKSCEKKEKTMGVVEHNMRQKERMELFFASNVIIEEEDDGIDYFKKQKD